MIKTYKYGEITRDEIFSRVEAKVNVEQVVADIIATVREKGDEALKLYSKKFDGVDLDSLEVTQE